VMICWGSRACALFTRLFMPRSGFQYKRKLAQISTGTLLPITSCRKHGDERHPDRLDLPRPAVSSQSH
jgi:hypothetical protein